MMTSYQAVRGCMSSFKISKKERIAEELSIDTLNSNQFPISVQYRSSENDVDILRHVFYWDCTPCNRIFQHGIKACNDNYDLNDYVDPDEDAGFISTTISNTWCPDIPYDRRRPNKEVQYYRYEIFAPGGIWVKLSMGELDPRDPERYDDVAFVKGIAPQYIRSAQLFKLKANRDSTPTITRVNNELIINNNFNPQSYPFKLLKLELPICDFINKDNVREALTLKFDSCRQERGNVKEPNDDPLEWYSRGVTDILSYLSAAIKSTTQDEAYYIQKKRVAYVNYDPTGNADKILEGPYFWHDMFEGLKNTPFGHHGVDCAFGSHNPYEAYIFCGNLCTLINYGKDDGELQVPTTITSMFPFLKGTIFECGIDAAFEATTKFEAFFFKGNQCASVKYSGPDARIISIDAISKVFPALKGKVHEEGVDAAHASHLINEVYLFHHNTFAQINYCN